MKKTFLFFLLCGLSFGAAVEDIHNPRYVLPDYPKKDLQKALAKIPAPAKVAIQKAVPASALERLEWVEGVLRGSRVLLAQVIKVREQGEDGSVGDDFVYFLIEITPHKVRLHKLYEDNYPVDPSMAPVCGFVEDPALRACHLDFYVNLGQKDFFQFTPGKGAHVVLSCFDSKYNSKEDPNSDPGKQVFDEYQSSLFPEKDGRLRVETLHQQGVNSLNPDPAKAAAESTKSILRLKVEYRWNDSKAKYEPVGAPVTQKIQ